MQNQDPAAVRDAARQILDQPEFGNEERSFFEQAYHYLLHPIEAIVDGWYWILDHLPWSDPGAALFAWLLVSSIVALVVYVVIRMSRSTAGDSKIDIGTPPLPHAESASELLALASELEARQEWMLALRARYGALVAQLSDAGVVQRRAGRTTGEYAREVGTNAPSFAASFTEATALFELAWYGDRATDADDVEQFGRLSDSIVNRRSS